LLGREGVSVSYQTPRGRHSSHASGRARSRRSPGNALRIDPEIGNPTSAWLPPVSITSVIREAPADTREAPANTEPAAKGRRTARVQQASGDGASEPKSGSAAAPSANTCCANSSARHRHPCDGLGASRSASSSFGGRRSRVSRSTSPRAGSHRSGGRSGGPRHSCRFAVRHVGDPHRERARPRSGPV
jgi:hypothetical protein